MVYSVRMECGRMLAREAYVEADIVSSVPESGTAAAHGFAREVCRGISTFCLIIFRTF
jgi:amidophosphoribosyltransferase